MNVREFAKRVLPKPLLMPLLRLKAHRTLDRAYGYDRRRFRQFSSSVDPFATQQNLASRITESYHNIEKGLSLPSPRPGFGAEAIRRLVDYVDQYVTMYGQDHVVSSAVATLAAYRDFNLAHGLPADTIADNAAIERLQSAAAGPLPPGGVRWVKRDELAEITTSVHPHFFESRASVRHFEPGDVDMDDIAFAARAAQKSPAVCNRQYSKVYLITEPEKVERALKIQGGARGFRENVPAVAVITTNLRNFWSAGERMQPWTDGGMFAMSFVLGLHARGLGSVCLNWSKTADVDQEFRSAFALPSEEVIVMLIAIGRLPEEFRVAVSPRVPLAETLRTL